MHFRLRKTQKIAHAGRHAMIRLGRPEICVTDAKSSVALQLMRKLPKIVLALIVLMAVFSPFMQLDSWDRFPVATGDIELQIISVLFETGMFFVFAGLLKLFPVLLRSGKRPPVVIFSSHSRDVALMETDPFYFAVPLRI
jgi:hypothetical protein